jgi:hypothetical protein
MPRHKFTKREMTQLVCDFYKITGETPKIKHLPHLPFSKQRVVKLFQTWNNMLEISGLEKNRNKPVELKCKLCKSTFIREIKELKKGYKNSFCSSACNSSFNTKGRKHTEETKKKISDSLKAHRIFYK